MEHRPPDSRDQELVQKARTVGSSGEDSSVYSIARAKKKTKKKFTQLHLDIGQKNFHSSTCRSCGFVYTAGDPEEERLHDLHHKEVLSLSAIRFKCVPSGCKKVADYRSAGGIYKLEHDPASPKSAMVSFFPWFLICLAPYDLWRSIYRYHAEFHKRMTILL
jgi:hypothetical protein